MTISWVLERLPVSVLGAMSMTTLLLTIRCLYLVSRLESSIRIMHAELSANAHKLRMDVRILRDAVLYVRGNRTAVPPPKSEREAIIETDVKELKDTLSHGTSD
jgi:hypothetical protein